MVYTLDFEVQFNDERKEIFGPNIISKECSECKNERIITDYYTMPSGSGMYGGFCHVGKCKFCWNKKSTKSFSDMPVENQQIAIKLFNTTRWTIKKIATDSGISTVILGQWLKSKPAEIKLII